MEDRWSAPLTQTQTQTLGGGTPFSFWGPKLLCWPAGGQVEAKKCLKMGQNRPKTGLFPEYSQNTPKIRQKALVCLWGTLVLGKGAVRTALAIFGDKLWLYIAFRGGLTPDKRCTAQVEHRVSGPAGLAPQGSFFIVTCHAVLVK